MATPPSKRRRVFKETSAQNKLRFEMELEFVQLLANPSYLQYLAQHKYFEDPSFLNYLQYLQYWRNPEYAKFIVYPYSLFFLDRLQEARFRRELVKQEFIEYLHRQTSAHWQFYRPNRIRASGTASNMMKEEKEGEGEGDPDTINYNNDNNNNNNTHHDQDIHVS